LTGFRYNIYIIYIIILLLYNKIDGEGCFSIVTNDSARTGKIVSLRFSITQHARDTKLLESFINYLGCGSVVVHNTRSTIEFIVTRFTDIQEKIIPFFVNLQGIKLLNFNAFTEGAELIQNKTHTSHEGLKKIQLLKAEMNKKG
jgi:hypothetical protein